MATSSEKKHRVAYDADALDSAGRLGRIEICRSVLHFLHRADAKRLPVLSRFFKKQLPVKKAWEHPVQKNEELVCIFLYLGNH